jgi:hypothetical protein
VKRDGKLTLTALACLVAAAAPAAYATTYSGQVTAVQTTPSPTTPGNVRVSIQVTTATTACGGFGGVWYSYDLPAGPTSSIYGAILVAAINTGRSVQIIGSGTCDAWNIETVAAIAAQ